MKNKANRTAVIGWPIEHSRSPLIHNYWLKKYGISGSYEKIAVPPEELPAFFSSVRAGEFLGCNVTIPHKQNAFDLVDRMDETTQKIGAINTVYRKNGELVGKNTDGVGFLMNLKAAISDWNSQNKRVCILGAGGASRAIAMTFLDDGARSIVIANRSKAPAEGLVAQLSDAGEYVPLTEISQRLGDCDLLINTTSLGMTGQPPLEVNLKNLSSDCVVSDIVYAPLQTNLLKTAKLMGNRVVDGLGMLLYQAVPGFHKWYGVEPEVTSELRNLIIADL